MKSYSKEKSHCFTKVIKFSLFRVRFSKKFREYVIK